MNFDIQLLRRCCRHRKILHNESLLAKIGAKFLGKIRSAVGARTRVDPGDGAHALVADREAGVDAGVRAAQHLGAVSRPAVLPARYTPRLLRSGPSM